LEQTEISFSLQGETPWLYQLLKLVNPGTYRGIDQALTNVIAKATSAAKKAKEGKLNRHNILSGMIEACKAENAVVNDFGLGSQASALVIAGSGTTSSTLTYATWLLLTMPNVRQKLEAELLTLPNDFDDLLLEKQPFLSAFITEVLRLYGSAPGGLPRSVPAHGMRIGDLFIPPGTTVSAQAYTMHRQAAIFQDPEK
jgi:cytochrome P450